MGAATGEDLIADGKKLMEERSSRWWDAAAVLLLLAALLTAAGRVVATEWVEHLNVVPTLVLLGTAAGLALGQSTFSSPLATLYAILYGVFTVPWQLGITTGYLSDEALWSERMVVLAGRLVRTYGQLAQQEPVQDSVLFLTAVAVAAWALSVHAGYALTRRAGPWRVALPPGLALLLVQTSDPYRAGVGWYLAAYAFFSLLLVTRLTFLRLRRRWVEDEARIPPLVGLDLSYAVVLVVSALLVLAWAAPTAADVLPAARRAWDRVTSPLEERTERLFASLQRQGPTITAANYYGEDFPLGQGRRLSDALIASVQAPQPSPGVRYYWRARVYDHYEDGLWNTDALTVTQRVQAGALPFAFPNLEGRRVLTFTVTSPAPLVTLYVAPQPRWVSRAVNVDFGQNPDGTVDVASVHAEPPLPPGQSYGIRSSVADVTVAELREAGSDYDEWVLDRYLGLPDTITPRTRELAEWIADGHETPYDVAAAVTRYLRDTIRYTETLTNTPASGQERLDWFLFDEQAGFCNYYASAQVVLLRSVGIPARLGVGFAQGERQRGTNTYVVYERNGHAWPEVYFPGFGWIEFEPTVSEDPINRPLGDIDDEEGVQPPGGEDTQDRWEERLAELEGLDNLVPGEGVPTVPETPWYRSWAFAWTLIVVMSGILVLLAWRAWRRGDQPPLTVVLDRGIRRLGWRSPAFLRRWADRAQLSSLERAYDEIRRALDRLGMSSLPAETPAERAAALADALPPASDAASSLLREYEAAAYGRRRHDVRVAEEASHSIRRLSWMAKLRRLVSLG